MDDATRNTIQDKIEELRPLREKIDKKSYHLQSVFTGLDNLLRDNPKNVDCTVMADEQIETYKTNLFRMVDEVLEE